jgi:hypothetical protein
MNSQFLDFMFSLGCFVKNVKYSVHCTLEATFQKRMVCCGYIQGSLEMYHIIWPNKSRSLSVGGKGKIIIFYRCFHNVICFIQLHSCWLVLNSVQTLLSVLFNVDTFVFTLTLNTNICQCTIIWFSSCFSWLWDCVLPYLHLVSHDYTYMWVGDTYKLHQPGYCTAWHKNTSLY